MDDSECNYKKAMKGLGNAHQYYYKKWMKKYFVLYFVMIIAISFVFVRRTFMSLEGGIIYLAIGLFWILSTYKRAEFITQSPRYQLAKIHGREKTIRFFSIIVAAIITVTGAVIILYSI